MTSGRGYPIGGEALARDLYRLFCIFAASPRVANLARKHERLEDLVAFEEPEASQLLISVAVIVRSYIDAGVVSWGQRVSRTVVGTLRADSSKPRQVSDLTLREACNKIIHAGVVGVRPVGKHRRSGPLRSHIRLYGAKGSTEWRADVDAYTFIEAGVWFA